MNTKENWEGIRDILPFGEPDRTIKHDGPIMSMTEEVETRDREQIKAYVKEWSKFRQCGKTGFNENYMNNPLKKYGRNNHD